MDVEKATLENVVDTVPLFRITNKIESQDDPVLLESLKIYDLNIEDICICHEDVRQDDPLYAGHPVTSVFLKKGGRVTPEFAQSVYKISWDEVASRRQ